LTITIAALVTTLGDFPLDPQAGLGWLWSADGRQLLWASPKALKTFGLPSAGKADGFSHQDTLRSMVADLSMPAPDREPVRVQQLSLISSVHQEMFMCLARAVALADGTFGILAVAVGAPARSLEDIRMAMMPQRAVEETAPVLQKPDNTKAEAAETAEPQPIFPQSNLHEPDLPEPDLPQPDLREPHGLVSNGVAQVTASADPPSWVGRDNDTLRPLRFVWQTDRDGRFVHLSRELSEAVGGAKAMLLGRTWPETAQQYGLAETDEIDRGFLSRETWTAKAVLWPVAETLLGTPVEMAGMPVREGDQFAGFRGYGIARIERAVRRPGSAAAALAQDVEPTIEHDEDRFGPAVARALAAHPAKPVDQAQPSGINRQQSAASPVRPDSAPLRRPLPVAGAADSVDLPSATHPVSSLSASSLPAANLPAVLALQKFIDESHRSTPATAQDSVSDQNPASMHAQKEPTGGMPVNSQGAALSDNEAGKNLTEQERRAFRDIAKALSTTRSEDSLPAPVDGPAPDDVPLNRRGDDTPGPSGNKTGPMLTVVPSISPESMPVLGLRSLASRPTPALLPDDRGTTATLLDKLPIGLLVMQQGQASFANRTLLDMLGYPDFGSFTATGGCEMLFARVEATGQTSGSSFTLQDSKGHAVMVQANIQAIDWNGAPASLTSFLPARPAASSENRAAVELDMMAARAELRELQFVLDTATDGIISLNSEGRILGLNRSAEALFGFDQNEIAGESITTLLAPESHAAALDYLEGLKVNGVASIMNDGRDIIGRERHGGSIPLFMTLGRLGDDKKAQRFCAVLRDVTAWKKAEADLQEAKRIAEDSNANKTDFLARISHEVRTPLNAILGFSQVMMAESLGPVGNAKYAQYAKDIHASGQHVLSLVNDLLDLSKVNAGKLELVFGSVDVQTVVAECVAMMQPQATAGKIIVRSQLSSRLPPVVADDRSLRQILLNLLSNAIKFTEPGGQVIVSATFNDQCEVIIRVRDTGIGMNSDELKSAMEPFRQVAGPRANGGTGLGLPLTKALVEANRASFSLSSERNKGTLAQVIFPSARVLAE
jgi:PAS domain S-box-containing protein